MSLKLVLFSQVKCFLHLVKQWRAPAALTAFSPCTMVKSSPIVKSSSQVK